ncbi:Copper transport protein CTR3 [Fusarium oxysporum f. sp. raphani]|uniref:Copper transport protein n=1 Tax=Fusarium oxysporum f. sp. raphani TaxID=96318 RepID=A0A8J5QC38_FUSOX|nr:Copper transport protein CTR3 [Fusarium oxysporum f. sp. raphani]
MDHDIAATATMHPAFATALASLSEEGAGNCTENPMLWNWNTIGTCFISKAWYMDSGGKFGITCFGAFMLVMLLEFLARVSREWERHRFARGAPNSQGPYAPAAGIELAVLQPAAAQPAAAQPAAAQPAAAQPAAAQPAAAQPAAAQPAAAQPAAAQPAAAQPDDIQPVASRPASATGPNNGKDANDANNDANPIPNFCPSFVEHAFINAILHTVQCIITYILILMAVSFNGYIIISMFIGAYVGALCFQRDPLTETRNPNAYQRAFQQPVVCCV